MRNTTLGAGVLAHQRLTGHATGRDLGQWHAGGLGHEGYRARGPRVDLQQIDLTRTYGELHVHQAHHGQPAGQGRGLAPHFIQYLVAQRVRRQAAGRITRVHAGLLDMLHDAADEDIGAVTDGIHVQLDRVL